MSIDMIGTLLQRYLIYQQDRSTLGQAAMEQKGGEFHKIVSGTLTSTKLTLSCKCWDSLFQRWQYIVAAALWSLQLSHGSLCGAFAQL
jgi:hypothetical protein